MQRHFQDFSPLRVFSVQTSRGRSEVAWKLWGAGVAAVPRWHPGLQPSLMTCTWLPHTPENKPHPSWELRRCTMMQDRTIWQVMILANGLLLHGLGWWDVVERIYKGLWLGAGCCCSLLEKLISGERFMKSPWNVEMFLNKLLWEERSVVALFC